MCSCSWKKLVVLDLVVHLTYYIFKEKLYAYLK
jgi:hypothetical protein